MLLARLVLPGTKRRCSSTHMPSYGHSPGAPRKAELGTITKDKLLLDMNLASNIIFLRHIIL